LDQAPISQVLLTIDKALQDELITDSGLKFYIDPSFRKEWQASVTATIEYLPVKSGAKEREILSKINVGDEVAISYRTVADFEFKGDGARFMATTEGSDHYREFVNGRSEWVRVYALPSRKGLADLVWVGFHLNKFHDIISGVQGTQSEVERWMSQFPFDKTDVYTFNNLFSFGGKDYWKCNVCDIFAKRVKGHLVAVGNRIICKPIEEDVPESILQNIRHHSSVKVRYIDRARVLSDPNKTFKKDEIISFDPNKVEKYEFWGKQYFLIREDLVLGKWHKN
jgi:hypothetical protein